ncbi:MAG: hypothetical protein V1735_06890 [Nanoarchaeota archaeon]
MKQPLVLFFGRPGEQNFIGDVIMYLRPRIMADVYHDHSIPQECLDFADAIVFVGRAESADQPPVYDELLEYAKIRGLPTIAIQNRSETLPRDNDGIGKIIARGPMDGRRRTIESIAHELGDYVSALQQTIPSPSPALQPQ